MPVEAETLPTLDRNYLRSRLRSHPDVARRLSADLIEPASAVSEPASAY
jgi:hypothetical protein